MLGPHMATQTIEGADYELEEQHPLSPCLGTLWLNNETGLVTRGMIVGKRLAKPTSKLQGAHSYHINYPKIKIWQQIFCHLL